MRPTHTERAMQGEDVRHANVGNSAHRRTAHEPCVGRDSRTRSTLKRLVPELIRKIRCHNAPGSQTKPMVALFGYFAARATPHPISKTTRKEAPAIFGGRSVRCRSLTGGGRCGNRGDSRDRSWRNRAKNRGGRRGWRSSHRFGRRLDHGWRSRTTGKGMGRNALLYSSKNKYFGTNKIGTIFRGGKGRLEKNHVPHLGRMHTQGPATAHGKGSLVRSLAMDCQR